jgi:VWFA-related protein
MGRLPPEYLYMRYAVRVACAVGTATVALAVLPHAQTPAPQSRFRGGTDLVQVDVWAQDGSRRSVRGLTAADFTLLVDGEPREIQAFAEIHLPDRLRPATTAATWVREVPSDVASNQTSQQEGRLVIIMLDRSIPVGEPSITAKRTAAAIVNQLGPGDLAAVVTSGGGYKHNLTSDRGRLLRTINDSDVSAMVSPEVREIEERVFISAPELLNPANDGRCLCGICVPDTITRVADAVQTTARRRKLLFFIGSDLPLQSYVKLSGGETVGCEMAMKDARNAMFAALDRANLTVHSFDPSGLRNVGAMSRPSSTLSGNAASQSRLRDVNEHLQQQGALSVLPDRTGGRTVVNTNAPDLQVENVFRESDSYYLIGFRPAPDTTSKAHTIVVRANRPGLKVHARTSYSSAPPSDMTASSPAPEAMAAPLRESLTGLLPTSDVPIDLNVATFATSAATKPVVALTVGISAFVSSLAPAAIKQGVPLEVVASAFDSGGRLKGVARQTIELSWPASTAADERRFDVLSRLDLPAGEYEIRVAVSGAEPRRTASVFSYVTVPAFDSTPLSLSSLVLGATAGTLTAPKDFLTPVLPIVPTARREFTAKDALVSFLRIYQGTTRKDTLLPVQLRSSLLNGEGKVVAAQSQAIEAAQFSKDRGAEHYLTIPLANLEPGDYLLRLEAEMGARTAGGAVRFVIK